MARTLSTYTAASKRQLGQKIRVSLTPLLALAAGLDTFGQPDV